MHEIAYILGLETLWNVKKKGYKFSDVGENKNSNMRNFIDETHSKLNRFTYQDQGHCRIQPHLRY